MEIDKNLIEFILESHKEKIIDNVVKNFKINSNKDEILYTLLDDDDDFIPNMIHIDKNKYMLWMRRKKLERLKNLGKFQI